MRLQKDHKIEVIRTVPLFAHCTDAELAEVSAIADEFDFREGRQLAREGAAGQEFVVIVEGTAQVRQHDEVIAHLANGAYFGEIALIRDEPRTASVVATSRVHALIIEGHAFQRLLAQHAGLRETIERTAAQRLGRDDA